MSETREHRIETFQKFYKIYPSILHSFLNYDRYQEAELIIDYLGKRDIHALDFGCGVGDYGMAFLNNGWEVDFYDLPVMLEFVEFRLKEAKLKAGMHVAPSDWRVMFEEVKPNLIVFGEVLEHLDEAYDCLEAAVDANTTFIWTSSYPYIEEDGVFHRRGHSEKAGQDKVKCQKLLEKYYDFHKFDGQKRMWVKKEK